MELAGQRRDTPSLVMAFRQLCRGPCRRRGFRADAADLAVGQNGEDDAGDALLQQGGLDLFGDQGLPVALNFVVQLAHIGGEVDSLGVGEDLRAGLQRASRAGHGKFCAAAAQRAAHGVLHGVVSALVVLREVGLGRGGQFHRRRRGFGRAG